MKLDTSREWRLFLAAPESAEGYLPASKLADFIENPGLCPSPAGFAAAELAGALALLGLKVAAGRGDEDASFGIVILDTSASSPARTEERRGFAWRASEARVEIHGESEAGLLAGAYDFLDKAGFRWTRPGDRARVPENKLELAAASGRRENGAILPLLILGHGSYVEKAADYMLWAARNGYGGVFIHTTGEKLALGSAPISLYDSLSGELAPLAGRLGLSIELGGHGLSALLPRKLFKKEPDLFRMADGIRKPDQNFCPSNPKGIEIVSRNFAAFAAAHPEVAVFHVWPDDLPGGGWCSCPACSGLSPAAQSLRLAAGLAKVLEKARPGARLSFLAYHDTEDMAGAVKCLGPEGMPANLELLWAPRKRSWAKGYGDGASALNSSSRANFEAARSAFLAAGGKSVSIFEYWEDAILFKTAVPPLSACMEGDLGYYARGRKADKVGILLTGDRLPLAARPNLWLMPRILRQAEAGGEKAPDGGLEALWTDWCASVYGPAAWPMRRYWLALEAAWAINLDLEPGETELNIPSPITAAGGNPPADWGDPWLASAERLGARRARCEEAFDRLREAEAAMADARACFGAAPAGDRADGADDRGGAHGDRARAVEDEALEYAISSGIVELDAARLSAYHEAAQGEDRAAADIAVIALSILDGLYRSLKAIPDRRARRNAAFILYLNYGLRLRALARAPRNALRRRCGEMAAFLGLARRALPLLGTWEP